LVEGSIVTLLKIEAPMLWEIQQMC